MHFVGEGPYQAKIYSNERTVTNFSFEIMKASSKNNAVLITIPQYRKDKYHNKVSNFEQAFLFLPIQLVVDFSNIGKVFSFNVPDISLQVKWGAVIMREK